MDLRKPQTCDHCTITWNEYWVSAMDNVSGFINWVAVLRGRPHFSSLDDKSSRKWHMGSAADDDEWGNCYWANCLRRFRCHCVASNKIYCLPRFRFIARACAFKYYVVGGECNPGRMTRIFQRRIRPQRCTRLGIWGISIMPQVFTQSAKIYKKVVDGGHRYMTWHGELSIAQRWVFFAGTGTFVQSGRCICKGRILMRHDIIDGENPGRKVEIYKFVGHFTIPSIAFNDKTIICPESCWGVEWDWPKRKGRKWKAGLMFVVANLIDFPIPRSCVGQSIWAEDEHWTCCWE